MKFLFFINPFALVRDFSPETCGCERIQITGEEAPPRHIDSRSLLSVKDLSQTDRLAPDGLGRSFDDVPPVLRRRHVGGKRQDSLAESRMLNSFVCINYDRRRHK